MSKKKPTAEELEAAFQRYVKIKDECTRTGVWHKKFAAQFTEDCYYVEHAYGEFFGREAVDDYITRVMEPFPTMSFPIDWHVIDVENSAIIFQVNNAFPPPYKADGTPFSFPNISRLVYNGDGFFKEEQDWYNPAFGAALTTKAWRKAGGKFLSKEKLKMKYRSKV